MAILSNENDQARADLKREAFPERARRRQRRRRLTVFGSLVIVLIGTAVSYALVRVTSPSAVRPAAGSRSRSQPGRTMGAIVSPKSLNALAVAPDGRLYMLDSVRDQVLQRLANGKFEVVAGNGHRGFSGDGGPAVDARLSLDGDSGMVVAPDGTLYIANGDRVRAVLADGKITTVAGDGRSGVLLGSAPGIRASIDRIAGLTLGPDHDLYVATSGDIVKLDSRGILSWVAGGKGAPSHNSCGVYCNPAIQGDFANPDQLAFDGTGDLFVSDFGAFTLYEITSKRELRFVGNFRGDGAPGALVSAPDGSVVEAWRPGLSRMTSSGTRAIRGDLDSALGKENVFIGGDGVAVGPNGVIYADTNTGNAFTRVGALLEVTPSGRVTALWKAPGV